MIVGLELWQIIRQIEIDKGDKEFIGLSQYGMEYAIERYMRGNYSKKAEQFYNRNRLYFTIYYDRAEDLKRAQDRFNQERENEKNGKRAATRNYS